MGFLPPILALLILSKLVWGGYPPRILYQKGFKVPENKTLSLFLILSDKVLLLRNLDISILDYSECLKPKLDPAVGFKLRAGLYIY